MTPAIDLARQKKIAHSVHEYLHSAAADSYGLEAAEQLGVNPAQVFKTLVVMLDQKRFAVGLVPVTHSLNMKRLAKAAGSKKASMADKTDVARMTGYVLGGVSPLGQKKRLPTFIDSSACEHERIFISAGRRGLEIALSPTDLAELLGASFTELRD